MAMGIVTDKDFERELSIPGRNTIATSKSIPTRKPVIVEAPVGGRREGDVNVPESLRKEIGASAQLEGRQAALNFAASLGVSESSVAAYTNGANSTANYNGGNPELRPHIKTAKQKIVTKAQNRLNQALSAITPEKLQAAKLRDISGVATAMAGVIRAMEPQDSETEKPKHATVVLFAPRTRSEDEYQTIAVVE